MRVLALVIYVILLSPTLKAQYTISGQVKDETSGQVLSGANIVLKNTFQGAYSDFEGKFRLEKVKAGIYTLEISYLGFETFSQEINVNQNQQLNISLKESPFAADEIVVLATRVNEQSPIAYTNLDKEDIAKQNFGQDLPILLNFTPSIVTNSDAGAGVGYTNFRIRGTDATRINITINGIPLNDAESQGTFWVNMPDFASSVDNIQIQRGVGTSTNGAGAFGASVNIQTNSLQADPSLEVNNSYGSFNTWKHTVKVATGLIQDKFTVEARLSQITSDGFIDRAFSDLQSFYVSGGYYGEKSIIRANIFSGNETTFQAWYGIPEARLRGDVAGMQAFAARNFLNEEQTQNLLNSDSRTYNSQLYEDETDNYQQDHYQFFYTLEVNPQLSLNTALHYTRGRGYFEQLILNDALATYNLEPVAIGGDTISNSDIIRRLWLDNHFYGTTFSLNYNKNRLNLNFGGGWNRYLGKHFGEVIWARFASNSNIRERYYDNDATKSDFHIYSKGNYQLGKNIQAFVDLQYRTVNYSFLGLAVDDQLGSRPLQQEVRLHFFNPKLGLNYQWNPNNAVYASFSVGNKEPNRNDFVQSSENSRPEHETLYDIEVGYRLQRRNWTFNANYYAMLYEDQLVVTGALNDVGQANRVNVDQSYRTGIELVAATQISTKLSWQVNATFSQNRIQDFQESINFASIASNAEEAQAELATLAAQGFVPNPNTGQLERNLGNTDLAFSPNIIAGSQLEYQPLEGLSIAWLSKYVGEQFLDNTSSDLRKLDAFFVNDIRLIYSFKTKFTDQVQLSLLVNNIFDEEYEPNGYTFGYFVGTERISENFYYPQAGINFLASLNIKF